MDNLCGDCGYVHPKEAHPHTEYHQCTKYKVRLFHMRYHPDLICAPMCDKSSVNSGAVANSQPTGQVCSLRTLSKHNVILGRTLFAMPPEMRERREGVKMDIKMGSHTVCGYCGKLLENPSCGVCFDCQVERAAQRSGTQASQATNTGMDAIALWNEVLAYINNGGMVSEWILSHRDRINAVVAQQHHT